ncbi:hypothetical protein PG993_007921 [Apiospora rasikravindrae]|uniref:Uncharacterized protein n=1 Tax=Apiospora rasikravindrae TaxID=990691 RepID=A0ABR1SYV2_9PEZI
MLFCAVTIALWALLASFGAGFPIGTAVSGSAADLESTSNISNASLPHPTLSKNSSLPAVVRADPPPPTGVPRWDSPRWPFDPADPAADRSNPYIYQCNQYAKLHNQIPATGLVVRCTAPFQVGQRCSGWYYPQASIYQAFRAGGSILWSAYQSRINFPDWQVQFGTARYPRVLRIPQGTELSQVPIGLGTWRYASANRRDMPTYMLTTDIYEYPLVPNGVWPRRPGDNPGPDRVLFQLVRGIPLYIGVITYRTMRPYVTIQQENPSWGYISHVNGRPDWAAIGSMLYPGLNYARDPSYDNINYLTDKRRNMKEKANPEDVGGTYGPNDPPPPPPSPLPSGGGGGGDPGTGAGGGGSGNLPAVAPGGVSESGGGALGGSGAFDGIQVGIQAGNFFRKVQPLVIPGPSHIEL